MKVNKKFQNLFKGIALLLATLMLCIQVAEAFHHHARTGVKTQKQVAGVQQKVHSSEKCTLCQYVSHSHVSAANPIFSYLISAGIILLITNCYRKAQPVYGYRTSFGNKGPPAFSA